MPRRKKNRKRSNRFALLETHGHAHGAVQNLIKEAGHEAQRHHKTHRRLEKAHAANLKALADAERIRQLFISGVPPGIAATDVVYLLLRALQNTGRITSADADAQSKFHPNQTAYVQGTGRITGADPDAQRKYATQTAYVLRCEIRPTRNRHSRNCIAFVTVCSPEIAQALVNCSPLAGTLPARRLVPFRITIDVGRRPAIPPGSAWRAGADPGSTRWDIASVQVGERTSPSSFCSFWHCEPTLVGPCDTHVELSPVANVVAVTIGRKMSLLRGAKPAPKTGRLEPSDFERTSGKLRFEIHFRSICEPPRLEIDEANSENRFVCFSISRPPALFRPSSEAVPTPLASTWDFLLGSQKEIRWIRTLDPTQTSAFSRATQIRVSLSPPNMESILHKLHQLWIIEKRSLAPVTVKHVQERRPPDGMAIFTSAVCKFNVSFAVRYAVSCILSLGTVRAAEVDSDFWKLLSTGMTEVEALIVLDYMLHRLSSNAAFSRYNNIKETLKRTMNDLNIPRKQQSSRQETEHSSDETERSSDVASVGTEDTDEFIMEQYVDEMELGKLSIDDDQQSQQSAFESYTATRDSGVSRPSRQQTLIRRLIHTPTRTIALKAEPDMLNRVLREFSDHKHRFLRVSFCDEDGSSVAFAGSEDLYARVRAALRYGICVAGERFVFLAFSNSQLRDHSVWMYNETPSSTSIPPSADNIRAWMGDFSKIRVPGKYAARQGQVFSSSLGTLQLGPGQEELIEDIANSNGKYLFSDGIGTVSPNLAKAMAKKLRVTGKRAVPSAFQIRYGGAKGMLAVWDSRLVPRRSGVEVSLRPSMKKFDSKHRVLEVVGMAKCLPLYLNRQIIMLLSGLGVPDKPFTKLQASFLKVLNKAMTEDGTFAALQILNASGCAQRPDGKLKWSAPMMNPVSLFLGGLTCIHSEHLFNMMNAFRKRMIRGVKNRARIPLEKSQGICAIGVLDELGVLKPGEIFCQFRDPVSAQLVLKTGPVTVGRSPCLHPGDLQPVRAVDHKLLRHMVDVIVFPRKGARPLPSKLSGGDLDGDIFFCIFEKSISYPRETPVTPMNYEAPMPRKLEHHVRPCDVADFFVEYIRNDNLGQIANAHMIHADKESEGIFSKKCLDLASLHSTAVDFAKTGIRAEFTRDLAPKYEKEQYPDFMGKHKMVSYKSEKVLGKLFRACVASGNDNDIDLPTFPNASSATVDRIIDSFPVVAEIESEADELCSLYNYEMKKLMDHYGVQNEGEMVSGQVISFSSHHAQFQGHRQYMSQLNRMNRETNDLLVEFQEEFFEGLGQRRGGKHNTDTFIKACAWYRACRQQAKIARERRETVFLSFPWVVSDVLIAVLRNGYFQGGE